MRQINLLDEIIVDCFAGGGGASTGFEIATGIPVTIAINHDVEAIRLHKTNHPYTEHYQDDIWMIDPQTVCRGRPVGWAHFSPDCKHFSRAKGATPVSKKIRGLAWVVLRWAGTVRPRIISLENVPEFMSWGPVKRGKPVKAKSGKTFIKFISQLEDLGYTVEFKTLCAADYGAPTNRTRFWMIARCDGQPIVWPEPSHNKYGTGGKMKWRAAYEVIDFTLPCPSIFETRAEIFKEYGLKAVRPLRENTLKRTIRGVDKFTIKSGNPFIVPDAWQVPAINRSLHQPALLKTAEIMQAYAGGYSGSGRSVLDPIPTITAKDHSFIITPSLMAIGQTGGSDRIRSVEDTVHTQVSKAESCLLAPHLIQYHSERSESMRGQNLERPIMTIDGSNRYGYATAHLNEYYGNGSKGITLNDPLHTVTGHDRESLTLANLAKFNHTDLGSSCIAPLPTITAQSIHIALVKTTICKYTSNTDCQRWPEVRDLLNQYCGYTLKDDELLLLWINDIPYFIADIGMRMLTPRELYNAHNFPPDYEIEEDYTGKRYKKNQQVAKCGNSVPPDFTRAICQANWKEKCKAVKIGTMREFRSFVTA